jgi:hypothetical protein
MSSAARFDPSPSLGLAIALRACLALLAPLGGCCGGRAGAQPLARIERIQDTRSLASTHQRTPDTVRAGRREASSAEPGRIALPSGRAIADLDVRACRRLLDRAGVAFESVPEDAAPQVYAPVYVTSTLSGVSFGPHNGLSEHGMVDCRLAVALLAWAPFLQRAGVVRVEHFSTYRPGARVARSSRKSGHARAMAIDAARFQLEDGRVLEVDADWDERERGGEPCGERRREDDNGSLLRRVVCDAVQHGLFQVVLTPHHDRAHQNHVHLELVPGVDWSYVH